MPEIDVAAATAALEARGGMPTTVPTAGDQFHRDNDYSTEQAAPEAAAPESGETESTEVPETVNWTTITDEAILSGEATPEMLVAMRRGMNADFTQKSQEIAPWRKLGEELGVQDPSDFRAAAELYTQLQDPSNWPTFQKELSQYMQQYGMTPAEADAAATEKLTEFAPAEELEFDDGSDVAPLVKALQAQQAEIAAIRAESQQRDQQSRLAEQQRQIASSLQAQEDAIREAQPNITPAAMDAIYRLLDPNGPPNLLAAKDLYDKAIGAEVTAYLQSKKAAHETTPGVLGNGTVQTDTGRPVAKTLDEGHANAMAYLAAQAAAGV